jgi:hypothetical protein
VSWAPIGRLPHSLIPLIIGIIILNLAGQAISVTNQHLIVAIDPNASSRLIGSDTSITPSVQGVARSRQPSPTAHRVDRRLHSRRGSQHAGIPDLGR